MLRRLVDRLLGRPLDLRDRSVFHHVALIAFFAWVGLGADGLSSSAYGPEEAFRHLAGHEYLAVLLAVAIAITVFVISWSYTRIIEEFPTGGGGYLVASTLLGERAGALSGSALLVDYVLTIAISVASGANAIFAIVSDGGGGDAKLLVEVGAILVLVVLNLRGVKESVVILTPIFLVFLVTHAILILGAIGPHVDELGRIGADVHAGLRHDLDTIGLGGLALVLARAYALGGGTFTGIEAVSNGLAIMREPRVRTGRRTMLMMAVSLAFTAAGILLAYLLLGIRPDAHEPMNATLAKAFAGDGTGGRIFVIVTLVSEGALLFVAAQAGFIDGPRVMANMARDSWFPHQLAALSDRLTMRNGVFLMSAAALAVLLYTRGDVHVLVVMYSINVFLTFSLSNLGMVRLWWRRRRDGAPWRGRLAGHAVALALCATVLAITVAEKLTEGGWITILVTTLLLGSCLAVRRHYRRVGVRMAKLDDELRPLETSEDHHEPAPAELDPAAPTAVVLVRDYGGLGLHTLLGVVRTFPAQYRQVVFVSCGVVDSGAFKGAGSVEALEAHLTAAVTRYVAFARAKLGWAATSHVAIGTDAVAELERACRDVAARFPRAVVFAGQLVFARPRVWDRLLHNRTAFAIQERLQVADVPMVVLPVRVR